MNATHPNANKREDSQRKREKKPDREKTEGLKMFDWPAGLCLAR